MVEVLCEKVSRRSEGDPIPICELVGFQRVSVSKGEAMDVTYLILVKINWD